MAALCGAKRMIIDMHITISDGYGKKYNIKIQNDSYYIFNDKGERMQLNAEYAFNMIDDYFKSNL